MTFPVECPNCGKTFQAVNGLVGKEAKCKACQRVFAVEAPKGPEPPPLPVPREVPTAAIVESRKMFNLNALPTPLGLAGLAFMVVGAIPVVARIVVAVLLNIENASHIPDSVFILSAWSICGVPTILAGIVILAAAFTVHR